MNNHDYYPQNPPEPTAYITVAVIEDDPNDQIMYAIEEHIYETNMERSFLDPEELRIMELIKNEGNNTALII